jgi:ABC-type antimicrobial peptide transport system permease subunit
MNMDNENIEPPKWADRFFEWYCNPYMQEEILGDLYESFIDKVAEKGLFYARCWYWIHVFLFINRRTLSRKNRLITQLNSIDMFRNYLKIGFRNLFKNKGIALINILGMSLALGCCLVVFQFVFFLYFNSDSFHSKRDEIYVVQRDVAFNGEHAIWNNVPQPLGAAILQDFPQVKAMARVNYSAGILQYDDKIHNEWVSFVDAAFFELFDFPVKWGNPATFQDPEGIVLKDNIAEKYFGSNNPVGKELSIRFSYDGKDYVERFVVKGILDKTPINASFSNNILIPFDRQKAFRDKWEDWTRNVSITFIQTDAPENIATLKKAEKKYLKTMNEANETWDAEGLVFQALKTAPRTAYRTKNNPFNTAHFVAIAMLVFIATALLILVCFNYINITLAAASSRLKEISVRKVMGGNRQQIIHQFLSENVLICVFSLILAMGLAHYFFLPWFNNLSDIELALSFTDSPEFWYFNLFLILLTALGGAGYPAFYISKFQPVAILKKEFRLAKKSKFRKVLIGFQLFLTIITIFSTFVFMNTSQSLEKKDWGYNQHDLGVIRLQNGADFETFKNQIQANPDILAIAGSERRLGNGLTSLKVKIKGEERDVKTIKIDDQYLNAMEMDLIAGRNFNAQLETDQQQSILVNEAFRKKMNWEQAEGQEVVIGGQPFFVIGEVRDFHYRDFFESIKPVVFQMGKKEDFRYVHIRTTTGKTESTIKALATNWRELYPHAPYRFYFQDHAFSDYFVGFGQVNSILSAATFMTVLISIMGLFGLAMLLLTRKMKELSIRKILGANFFEISHLINKEFLKPLIFSLIIGLPISFFLMQQFLNQICPGYLVGMLPFILTIFSILLMLLLSLVRPLYAAMMSNPSNYLKDE